MICENISRVDGEVYFAGHSVRELAEKYGTPLYLMDEERIRSNCRMYTESFAENFNCGSAPIYASKAASFKEMYRIINDEGMCADVVSLGELSTALEAGFPAGKIFFHGNAKTDEDIRCGILSRTGCFIVDNEEELFCIQREAESQGIVQPVQLRVTPGIDPHTYEAINTGMVDSKFGVAIETGQAIKFVEQALELKNIYVCGLHCHVGSQVFEEDVFHKAVDVMAAFMEEIYQRFERCIPVLNLGGGYGVPYLEGETGPDIRGKIKELAEYAQSVFDRLDYPMPAIMMEPGRSIVADAGMTVYTVSSVKRIPGYKSYVAIDGGMADNPRYALYKAPYTAMHVTKDGGDEETFDLVGRCCESDDIIQPAIKLPSDTKRGDLIAVCTTGAYNFSMASNYNRLPRPALVMLSKDGDRLAVKRESYADLMHLDV